MYSYVVNRLFANLAHIIEAARREQGYEDT